MKSKKQLSRRDFLTDAMKVAIVAGLPFRLPKAMAAGPGESIIFVFLRGGADGLSMVQPKQGGAYQTSYAAYAQARGSLKVDGALPLGNTNFTIHPALAGLKALFESRKLSVILGAGSTNNTRSHFEQQDLIEFGNTDRVSGYYNGFLNRTMAQLTEKSASLPAVSIGSRPAKSVRGSQPSVALPADLRSYVSLTAPAVQAGLTLEQRLKGNVGNRETDATYPEKAGSNRSNLALKAMASVNAAIAGRSSLTLGTVADYGGMAAFPTAVQLLAADPGLRCLTLDVGGWDHHNNMGVNDGAFNNLATKLNSALSRLAADLEVNGLWNRTTVVVMSEFGRRLAQNGSAGLDHGRGGVAFVMGGQVKGGRIVKETHANNKWNLTQLEEPGDVRVTVDYRHIFAEILMKRMGVSGGANGIGEVFPGFSPKTLDIMKS